MAQIKTAVKVIPRYTYSTTEVLEAADSMWLSHLDPAVRKLALRIFEGAGIESRSSAFSIETIFSDLSFKEKNDLYVKAAIELAEIALKQALDKANLDPKKIDYLITTSCTGFMIPSVDAYVINKLGLRQDVIRLPITEMGCAAGMSALIYANQFSKANPDAHIAIVAVELPSITFQKNDLNPENIVSTAIFADGAAAVIVGPTSDLSPKIVDTDMYHFTDATHLMGFELRNSGLKIVLDRDVPDAIFAEFEKFFLPLLNRNNLKAEDIRHYLLHPGGKKIINRMDDYFGRIGKDLSISKNVLKVHGNLSSCTIYYILEETLRSNPQKGDWGYMLAFGPGFSAQSLLLKWE